MKILKSLIDKYREFRFKKMFPALIQAFKVTSHLNPKELCRLFLLANDRKYIMEIGSYIGASACCFGAALKKAGSGKIICIDTWNNDAMTEGNRDTWQEFQNNTVSYKEQIIPIRGYSTNVVDEVAAHVNTLDLLFIDGDHSYEGVKADWEAYKHFLCPGSIVAFHDSGWAEGVKRVIEEDAMQLVASFDSLPNMWWGVIK
jgi:predicted O-methyltransferase YrrM